MKVFWIVNTFFPDICLAKKMPVTAIGGWMYASAELLAKEPNIELVVATVHPNFKLEKYKINNITYYLLPSKNVQKYNSKLETYWKEIFQIENPDVVHIHGTEFPHGLAAIKICAAHKFIISIQGLISVYARYYLGGIDKLDILTNQTIRDIIRGNLLKEQKRFEKRGFLEREYIQKTSHVIGRTSWDYTHTKLINPTVKYHFCNEALRGQFYTAKKWDLQLKKNYRIFLSQAGYPIKGLHQVIKAISFLRKEFPDIEIMIGGVDILCKESSFIHRYRRSGYGKYIQQLSKKEKVFNQIQFLGMLSEEQMIVEYQKAHVFICPSSIENSPNSIGEAQIIGTPVISSYVGGVPDMVEHGLTGLLYRFEEVEMLAMHIKSIFENDEKALQLSKYGIAAAEKRHNMETILHDTLEAYHYIADHSEKK